MNTTKSRKLGHTQAAVLSALSAESAPVRAGAVAEAAGYPVGSTRQALLSLVARGLVAQDGPRFVALPSGAVAGAVLASEAGVESAVAVARVQLPEAKADAIKIAGLGSFLVHEANLPGLKDAIAKLGRRAVKLGQVPPGLSIGGRIVVESPVTSILTVTQVLYSVRVTGSAPKVAGFEFVARLEHLGAGTIIKAVPTASLSEGELARFRGAEAWCEHCATLRRRKDTFVVRSEDGSLLQVGRSCLADFLGHKSPEAIARLAETLAEIESSWRDEDGFCGSRGVSSIDLSAFLAAVVCYVEEDGWLSRTKARDSGAMATADVAWLYLQALYSGAGVPSSIQPKDDSPEAWARRASKATELLGVAEAALASKGAAANDYEHNLSVVIAEGRVTEKVAGYAGSIVGYATRLLEAKVAGASWAETASKSSHVGAEKERLTVRAQVLKARKFEGYYGMKTVVQLLTEGGDLLLWWATGSVAWAKVGETLTLKATVAEHKVNTKGAVSYRETVVKRVAPVQK